MIAKTPPTTKSTGTVFPPAKVSALPDFLDVPFYRNLDSKNQEKLKSRISELHETLTYRACGWKSERALEILSMVNLSLSRFTLFMDRSIFKDIVEICLYDDSFELNGQKHDAYIETYSPGSYLLNLTSLALGLVNYVKVLNSLFPEGPEIAWSNAKSAERYRDFVRKVEELKVAAQDLDQIKPSEKTAPEQLPDHIYGIASSFLEANEDLSYLLLHERCNILDSSRESEAKLLDMFVFKLESLAHLVDRQQWVFRKIKEPFHVLRLNLRHVLKDIFEPDPDGRDIVTIYFGTLLLRISDPERCDRDPGFITSFLKLTQRYFSHPSALSTSEPNLYRLMTEFYHYVPPEIKTRWFNRHSKKLQKILDTITK